MIVHHYTSKKNHKPFFRLLCTGEYFEETRFKKSAVWGRMVATHVTHRWEKTTCPKCLEILIPQAENNLKLMKGVYERAKRASDDGARVCDGADADN